MLRDDSIRRPTADMTDRNKVLRAMRSPTLSVTMTFGQAPHRDILGSRSVESPHGASTSRARLSPSQSFGKGSTHSNDSSDFKLILLRARNPCIACCRRCMQHGIRRLINACAGVLIVPGAHNDLDFCMTNAQVRRYACATAPGLIRADFS